MDSVPNGGWLDGCLNVLAGAEVLRRIAEDGTPPVTVRLVDWADEEGARFGRSLFGSSAAAGSMADQDELRKLADRDGVTLPDAIAAFGVDLDRALDARCAARGRSRLPGAPHRAGPRARVTRPAARRRPRHVRRRALADHVDGPGGARGLDADGQPPRRARRRGEARPRDPRRRARDRRRRGLHLGRRHVPAGDRHFGRRDGGAAARPAAPRRRQARSDARARAGALARVRRGGADRRRLGADLVDRADPLRRDADRLRRRGDPRGCRHVPPASRRGRCTTQPRSPARASRR